MLSVGVIAISLLACSSPSGETDVEPGVLMRVEISGPPVERNDAVLSKLAGTLRPSSELVRFASCHNVADWLNDVTLRDNVAVSSNALLIRVAELLASGKFDPDLVLAVETQFWDSGIVSFDDIADVEVSQADFARYVEARLEPPSEGALKRFVVYASTMTMSVQGITYLDTSTVSRQFAQSDRAPTHAVRVVTADAVEQFEIPASECLQ
jgi:hypothetical protein